MTTLVPVADDPKLLEIAQIITELDLSRRALAHAVGITPSTLDYWIATPSARVRDRSRVDTMLKLVREKRDEFSTNKNTSRQIDTTLPYNLQLAKLDSAQLETVRLMSQPIEFEAVLAPTGQEWSAKKVQTKMRKGSAYPASMGMAVQIDGKLGQNIRNGCILIFKEKEDDYLAENVFFLLERQNDSDIKTIGWFDPILSTTHIQTEYGQLPITEWKATHFAWCVMWGGLTQISDSRVSETGIGPSMRL